MVLSYIILHLEDAVRIAQQNISWFSPLMLMLWFWLSPQYSILTPLKCGLSLVATGEISGRALGPDQCDVLPMFYGFTEWSTVLLTLWRQRQQDCMVRRISSSLVQFWVAVYTHRWLFNERSIHITNQVLMHAHTCLHAYSQLHMHAYSQLHMHACTLAHRSYVTSSVSLAVMLFQGAIIIIINKHTDTHIPCIAIYVAMYTR